MRLSESHDYYVTRKRQGRGFCRVHRSHWIWLARANDPVPLGSFVDCQSAPKQAKEK